MQITSTHTQTSGLGHRPSRLRLELGTHYWPMMLSHITSCNETVCLRNSIHWRFSTYFRNSWLI